jgi:L-amino acid N-acyltransferase YncA
MTATIRTATTADGEQIAAIYAPSVVSAATSFEMDLPTGAEMARRVADALVTHPWLVAERGGELLGYARGGRFRERAAYGWSVETSVYIRGGVHRTGVGRALYTALFEILVLQGYYVAYAGATLPNDASAGLHESMGFTPVGIFRAAGNKFGVWHDVGWWQRLLQPLTSDPPPPKPLAAVIDSPAYACALANGARLLTV